MTEQKYFKEDRYSGDVTVFIADNIQDFEVCSMQMRLNPDEKANISVKIFKSPTLRFFLSQEDTEMKYEEREKTMR